MTNWIVSKTFGKDYGDEILKLYSEGKNPSLLPETLTPYLFNYKTLCAYCSQNESFFEALLKKIKLESYPVDELDEIWNQVILRPIKIDEEKR